MGPTPLVLFSLRVQDHKTSATGFCAFWKVSMSFYYCGALDFLVLCSVCTLWGYMVNKSVHYGQAQAQFQKISISLKLRLTYPIAKYQQQDIKQQHRH